MLRLRKALALGFLFTGFLFAGAAFAVPDGPAPSDAGNARARDPVIVAAGDIACDPESGGFNNGLGRATSCRQKYTAELVRRINPVVVLNLGDAQYEYGTRANFAASYDKSWGAFKAKTWVAAGGSHDYYGGGDFYTYFGSRAGPAPYKNWYSFDVGAWHVVVLNSQCSNDDVGGCEVGSEQEKWLRRDLAKHRTRCTLAMWHNARWSSGPRHGSDTRTDSFVRALYAAGAEIVLSGHDHDYERFAPQNPDGNRDDARGLVQFVVGTGGKSLEGSFGTIRPNSLTRTANTFGVLKLTLHPTSYEWEFVRESGQAFSDSGSANCR